MPAVRPPLAVFIAQLKQQQPANRQLSSVQRENLNECIRFAIEMVDISTVLIRKKMLSKHTTFNSIRQVQIIDMSINLP